MLLRDVSQIEHKKSTQHSSTTSLPGIYRDRAEQADVSYKHLVNQSKGYAGKESLNIKEIAFVNEWPLKAPGSLEKILDGY